MFCTDTDDLNRVATKYDNLDWFMMKSFLTNEIEVALIDTHFRL